MTAIRYWGGRLKCCVALAPWFFLAAHSSPPASLIAWRDQKIDWILKPVPGAQGPVLSRATVIAKCGEVLDELHAKFGGDLGVLHRTPGADAEVANFVRFVTAQQRQGMRDADGSPTHLLGGSESDLEYLRSIRPYVTPTGLLADQALLSALQDPSTYYKAIDMLTAQNRGLDPSKKWLVLAFRSQFILSVDRATYGRLLVIAPVRTLPDGSELEQWFQFALATPSTPISAPVRSVSCIARVRRPDGHTEAYFVDYFRTADPASGRIAFQPTFGLKPMPSSDCFNCHKTAVLPIYPKSLLVCSPSGVSESPTGENPVVRAINARMLDWYRRTPSQERTLVDPADYGPSLGAGDLDGALASVAAEAGIDKERAARIRRQMTCTNCHGAFAPLNYDLSVVTDRDAASFESHRGLAQSFVENGTMPPGNDLTPDDRKILWQALARAYFDPTTRTGALVDWLKAKP